MKKILILGAGTGGTILANRLCKALPPGGWQVTIVDQDDRHHYQPGYLFVPFGTYKPSKVVKSRRRFLPKRANYIVDTIKRIDPAEKTVELGRRTLDYDYLIIATGTQPRPDATPGMLDPVGWRHNIFDFYTLEGAIALRRALERFNSGRIVINICEMPIKCPVAPLEFALLADVYLFKRRRRDDVQIVFVTPLDGPFTKPVASRQLGRLFKMRDIESVNDFAIERVDAAGKKLVSFDGREVDYDLLVTVPVNMGAQCVIDSGLGDDLGFVPVNIHTLQSLAHPDIFAVGDAAAVPTSKAGSVMHFESESFVPNFLNHIAGKAMTESFDGHSNCFIEAGHGKALLLDFNYEVQPVTGVFPVPKVGPLALLRQSYLNHVAKLAFYPMYWYFLLKGIALPFPRDMPLAGKEFSKHGLDQCGQSKTGQSSGKTDVASGPIPAKSPLVRPSALAKPLPQTKISLPAEPAVASPKTATKTAPSTGRTAGGIAQIGSKSVSVNEEGFLTNPADWDEELGAQLGQLIGIELSQDHWEVVHFVRTDFLARGATPTLRRMSTQGGFTIKELFALFPGKPAKKIAYIAGVPKPVGCV